ncbi:toll/interleukin-1 receptor domain-containing protein [Chitinophaga sp. Ak27]|uniref:toll/interleukin-1 receptor domain-containing protein n=1 Tax=Chitinophaga sp. Ak27 TaxID=2726116 RepID=UPI00145D09A4|nr:toll/interleukin-1 receptor domain-containing protein [Chitinophaga sp. Ak27]NLU94902.1 TIR domain-containing protein [Chitinophaga sp. Ak27]
MNDHQKLNQILEFIVIHPERININAHTIQEILIKEPIDFNEAQSLHRQLMVSRVVRVIGSQYLAYSFETLQFLERGGFGGLYRKKEQAKEKQEIITLAPAHPTELNVSKVFISYAWGEEEDQLKVLSFTNHLRKNGFHAEIDQIISQRYTAPNFKEMMVKAMQYDKVVVVLSEKYKIKADQFEGGVGTEFKLLINDMEAQPNKYILVSFKGRQASIIPFALQGYDVVDVSASSGMETLMRKLTGQPKYVFAEVAAEMPIFKPVPIPEFNIEPSSPIKPEQPAMNVNANYSIERYALQTNLIHFKFNRIPNHQPVLIEWYRFDLDEEAVDDIRGFTYQELEEFKTYAVNNTLNFGGPKDYKKVTDGDIPEITEYDLLRTDKFEFPSHLIIVPQPEVEKSNKVSDCMEILLINENGITHHDYKLPYGVIGKILNRG